MTSPLAVHRRLAQGAGLGRALVARAPFVSLDWDRRQRSRLAAEDSAGRALAIVLPRGSAMRGGDVLVAEDGSLVRVVAADQALVIARPRPGPDGAFALLRAAYHLGNRHVSLELRPESLRLEPDPVLEALLERMGLAVEHAQAPFEPEAGAYAEAGPGHTHGHAHGHTHAHTDEQTHEHIHGQTHEHAHDHTHDHAHDPSQGRPHGQGAHDVGPAHDH